MRFFEGISKALNSPAVVASTHRRYHFDLTSIEPVNPVVDELFDVDDPTPDETEFETGWKVCLDVSLVRDRLELTIRTEKSIIDCEHDQRLYKRNVRYVKTSASFELGEDWTISSGKTVFAAIVAIEKTIREMPLEFFVHLANLNDVLMAKMDAIEQYEGENDVQRFASYLRTFGQKCTEKDVLEGMARIASA